MAMDGQRNGTDENITCHPTRYNSPIKIMPTQSDTRQIISSHTVATTARIHPSPCETSPSSHSRLRRRSGSGRLARRRDGRSFSTGLDNAARELLSFDGGRGRAAPGSRPKRARGPLNPVREGTDSAAMIRHDRCPPLLARAERPHVDRAPPSRRDASRLRRPSRRGRGRPQERRPAQRRNFQTTMPAAPRGYRAPSEPSDRTPAAFTLPTVEINFVRLSRYDLSR